MPARCAMAPLKSKASMAPPCLVRSAARTSIGPSAVRKTRTSAEIAGKTASDRRPARMGAPVKSPDVGVFVRPGRLPTRMGAIAVTERALWPRLRHLQVAEHSLQSFLVGVMVLPPAEITDVAVVAQLAGPCF